MHTGHHARPWDGNHINGTIGDTLPFTAGLGALSLLAPLDTVPVLWAAVVQCYVVEEWIHHSTHYATVYGLRNRYSRYITRHHAYHHSPRGSELAFGLTSGFWDAVFGTRIPAADRAKVFGCRARRPGTYPGLTLSRAFVLAFGPAAAVRNGTLGDDEEERCRRPGVPCC